MRFKRPVAAGLAAVMFAGNLLVPGSFDLGSVVRAAEGDDEEKVVIKYDGSSANSYDMVIGGDGVNIIVDKPDYYVPSGVTNGLIATDSKQSYANGDGMIQVDGEQNEKTLSILDKFSSSELKSGRDYANLTIRGAFDALPTKGTARDSGKVKVPVDNPDNPNAYREVDRQTYAKDGFVFGDTAISVYETSSIILNCEESERAGGAPVFKVIKATGSFACYDTAIAAPRATDTEPLVITLTDENEKNNPEGVASPGLRTITYLPPTLHDFDDQGIKFKKDDVLTPNSFVQKNTEVTFTFNKVESNQIFLQVYTPRSVAKEIARAIRRQDGVSGTDYIDLADGDTLSFIRNNFSLYYSKELHHSNFYINWKWVPELDKISQETKDKYGDTAEAYAKVVELKEESGGRVEVTVNPLYWDITGHLEAEIRYRTSDLNVPPVGGIGNNTEKKFKDPYGDGTEEVLYTEVGKTITIRGTGEPASLQRYSRDETDKNTRELYKDKLFTKDEEYTKLTDDTKKKNYLKVPQVISLDAYNGWISGTTIPKVPSKYTIALNMGLDNAASLYAEVNCVSGDEGIVTMQTQGVGIDQQIKDYSFGGKIENPNAQNPGSEGVVYLTFTPTPIGREAGSKTIELEVVFYVKGADENAPPVKARTQPDKFRITVTDSSPNNDATLEQLRAWADTGDTKILTFLSKKEMLPPDYEFSSEKTQYEFSLENRYKYVWFNLIKTDINANKIILAKATVRGKDADENIPQWDETLSSRKNEWDWTNEEIKKVIQSDNLPAGKSVMSEVIDDSPEEGDFYKIDDDYYRVIMRGVDTPEVPLVENEVVQVDFLVIAEDLSYQRYQVNVMRRPVGTDATLKSFTLTDDEGNVLFSGLETNKYDYDVEIPFKVQWVKVEYEMTDPYAQKDLTDFTSDLVKHGKLPRSEKVWIDVLTEVKKYDANEIANNREDGDRRRFNLEVKTFAENYDKDKKTGGTDDYIFRFHRSDPSEVNTLSNLTILDATNNNDTEVAYTPTFRKNMESSDFYEVHIPYSVKRLKIQATPDDSGASVFLRQPELIDLDEAVIDGRTNSFGIKYATPNGGRGWQRLANTPSTAFVPTPYDEDRQEETYFTVDVEVWPESLEAPDNVNTDQEGYARPTPAGGIVPPSSSGSSSSSESSSESAPSDSSSSSRAAGEENPDNSSGSSSNSLSSSGSSGSSGSSNKKMTVTYQQYIEGVMKYPIHIYRDPASREASLLSIEIKDQDGTVIPVPDFNPDELNYEITVPFETAKAQITPTATDPNVKEIRVNGKKVASGGTSALIRIKHPNDEYNDILDIASATDTIEVVVYPEICNDDEDWPPTTYTFKLIREEPSSDCLLIKLEAGNTDDFKPVFAPMRTDYSAKVAEGAEGITLTPTANHKGAKIEIDGKRVNSGETSELIHILTVNQTVEVKVTAQDGHNTKTYRVRYQNPNLIQKTSNADLSNLEVEPGHRRPVEFDPSVTEYDVAVDEDTFSVRLIPTPADPLAKMQVFRDSQEIGDEDGNYAAAIKDGANVFTIEVTSPDETKKKTYTVTVYRGDEENMGKLTPLHAEDIDYENSPDVIIVDVTKYPRIARDVFEELKNYPDKKIIFQGNDYSLQFDASDIENIIPQTEYFSFGMSFRSPLEVEISDEIYSHPGNDDANLVFVYFDYHGALPGPAVLTLSMGSKYKNSTYYWNYYNEERERVDYYGTVNTNSKGTFSLIVDHLSTYIISDQRLNGANDASTGETIGPLSPYNDNDLGAEAVEKKLIPNTGAVKIIGGEWKKGETE